MPMFGGLWSSFRQWLFPVNWSYWYPTTSTAPNGPREIAALPAVRRAMQHIARDLARCPVQVYRGRELVEGHRAAELLNGPDADATLSSFHFRRWEAACAISCGNAISLIHMDESDKPERLEALPPGSVELKQSKTGRLTYMVDRTPVDAGLLLHQRWDVDPNQPWWGVSPIENCARALRTAATREDQLERVTGDGMRGKLAFKREGALTPTAVQSMREGWITNHGPASSTTVPAFMSDGLEPMLLDPGQVQRLIDSRRGAVCDIALALDIPPQMLWEGEGRALTEVVQVYVDAVNGIAAGFAAEYTRKLCAPGERVVIATSSLLTSDLKSGGKPLAGLVQVGALTKNDARRRVGEQPLPDAAMDKAEPVISGVTNQAGEGDDDED